MMGNEEQDVQLFRNGRCRSAIDHGYFQGPHHVWKKPGNHRTASSLVRSPFVTRGV